MEGLHPWGGSASSGVGQTPPPSDTTGYGQRAGGTHPTIMHSCLCRFHLRMQEKENLRLFKLDKILQ